MVILAIVIRRLHTEQVQDANKAWLVMKSHAVLPYKLQNFIYRHRTSAATQQDIYSKDRADDSVSCVLEWPTSVTNAWQNLLVISIGNWKYYCFIWAGQNTSSPVCCVFSGESSSSLDESPDDTTSPAAASGSTQSVKMSLSDSYHNVNVKT